MNNKKIIYNIDGTIYEDEHHKPSYDIPINNDYFDKWLDSKVNREDINKLNKYLRLRREQRKLKRSNTK